jgi:chromosome segregation ATPase
MSALVDELRAGIPAYDVTQDGVELHDIDAAETLMSAAAAELTTLQSRLEAVEAERDAARADLANAERGISKRWTEYRRKLMLGYRWQRTRSEAAEARVEELQKALEPFEEVADEGNEDQPDDTPCTIQAGRSTCYGFTLKQFRDLRALLSHPDISKGGEE